MILATINHDLNPEERCDMEQLFNLMLSCLIILSLSACGKQSGMEQSGQSENAEPIEHTIISQAEETTEPATGTESTKAQEGYTMTNSISFNFETKTVMLNSGVRLIDTAYMYHNEESVGEAVRNSAIPREEIFVITKLYLNQFLNPEEAIEETLNKSDIDYMEDLLEISCGLDVHKGKIVACIPTGPLGKPTHSEIREFTALVPDMVALQDWIVSQNCHHAAMESIGIYWLPIYEILKDAFSGDITLLVVNARHMKTVPGKKTDMRDSEWISALLRAGPLNGSFIPKKMLMYGKEASNRKQEIDRQHHIIPNQRNQRPKDKHCKPVRNIA